MGKKHVEAENEEKGQEKKGEEREKGRKLEKLKAREEWNM